MSQICAALSKNASVTHLSLRWCRILKATPLAHLLASTSTLRSLDLSDTGLHSSSLEELCKGLAANRSLTSLTLNGNAIGDQGAKVLANVLRTGSCSALAWLDVGRACIGEPGGRALAEALRSPACALTGLSLEWNRLRSVSALTEALLHNTVLRSLHLGGGNARGNAKASHVAALLRQNSTLQSLGLEWTALTDAGVTEVADALSVNRHLTRLDLRGNDIREAGVAALSAALQANPSSALVALPFRVSPVPSPPAPPVLQHVLRCALLLALDRHAPAPSRLAQLPRELLHCIMGDFSFADTHCPPQALRLLVASVLAHGQAARAVLATGTALRLVERSQGVALML